VTQPTHAAFQDAFFAATSALATRHQALVSKSPSGLPIGRNPGKVVGKEW
jgi:hypothetical protein